MTRTPAPEPITPCGHTWRDGWGEHVCMRREHLDERSCRHRCECDATELHDDGASATRSRSNLPAAGGGA